MKNLFIFYMFLSLNAYSQTACFGTEQVKMLDIIELQETASSIPIEKMKNKISPTQVSVVKSSTLNQFSMNQGPKENITSSYYQNSDKEDVSHFKYNNKHFYRIRNKASECTAIYELDSSGKTLYLLSSLPASLSDGFFQGGEVTKDYQDLNLSQTNLTANEAPCKVIEGGIKIFSVVTKTCGRVKFCEMESLCKDSIKTEKYFCKAVDDQCPDISACKSDKSFSEIYKDFEEGTFRKETLPKSSAQ